MWEGRPAIKSAVIQVDIPSHTFAHAAAGGKPYADSAAPITPEHQFHLASVTKTMTATLVLQLWKWGALGARGLNTTLADLELFDSQTPDRIHVLNGVGQGSRITVRHLLSHGAGSACSALHPAQGVRFVKACNGGGALPADSPGYTEWTMEELRAALSETKTVARSGRAAPKETSG